MRLETIGIDKVKIDDQFWNKHIECVSNVLIPYQWDAINDRVEGAEISHSLENFKIAAGLSAGEYHGAVFQDTDVSKWLETVGYSLAYKKDNKLETQADQVIEIIKKAQCADGYLNTYYTIKEPDKRWTNLTEGHELYSAGHMIEAGIAYYYGTGKDELLKCCIRLADLICDTFGDGEGKNPGYPGHQEIELALIKLYYVTRERKYLDCAKSFLDRRGVGENYFLREIRKRNNQNIFPEFSRYDTRYSQSHLPVRKQRTAEGHAVRATYMYCAMADIAYEYQDQELMEACEALWNNIVQRRLYITGSIGSSGILERFTTDYDLPNTINYSESCASIGLFLFGMRMASIKRDSSYIDVAENALYNTILAGVALDGRSFFYVNPLEVYPEHCIDRTSREHVKANRQKWFGVACCPPNIARTLASLGQYICMHDNDRIYINLFISSESECQVGNSVSRVKIDTAFPWENVIKIQVNDSALKPVNLAVRIPAYAKNYRVTINGEKAVFSVEKGYAVFSADNDSTIEVCFESPARFVRANPLVRNDNGKVALMRGPLVYCFEQVDNGKDLAQIRINTKNRISETFSEELGGVVTLSVAAESIDEALWPADTLYSEQEISYTERRIKAVPYAYWNNRGEGEMLVWVRETS